MKDNTHEIKKHLLKQGHRLPILPSDLGHCDQHTHSMRARPAREQTMKAEAVTILVKMSTQALRILSGVAGLSSLKGSVTPESFLAE